MSSESTSSEVGRRVVDLHSRSDATYLCLRQEILTCTIAPGVALTESALMERYRAGKSTCRIALARLTQDGLVRSVPRHGYVVSQITLRDVEELFALRLMLEPAAARGAAGKVNAGTLSDIETAARNNTASRNKGNRIDFFLDANREFHLAIAMASGNSRLAKNIAKLLDEMKRLVALGFAHQDESPEIANDHVELIEALARGDAKGAQRIAERHIITFRDMTLEKVLQSVRASSELLPLVNPKRLAGLPAPSGG
jgi:DNA-binding GntR family transcriptional regulator